MKKKKILKLRGYLLFLVFFNKLCEVIQSTWVNEMIEWDMIMTR